jgi:acetyltransferase-like isoleucine patch superfamily enzyme
LQLISNPFDPGYYREAELRSFGFAAIGSDVMIAKNCTIINLGKISIGSHVRIDGNTTIIAGPEPVFFENYVHIGGGCHLTGGSGIVMENFTTLSQGVKVYSRSDDYVRGALTNPTIPKAYLNVKAERVVIRKHSIVGAGAVILPGVTLEEGTSVGALTLIRKTTEPWTVYAGNPAKPIAPRKEINRNIEARLLEGLK